MIDGFYEELFLNDAHLTRFLDKVIGHIGYDKGKTDRTLYRPTLTPEYALSRVSEESLSEAVARGDLHVATADCNVLKFNHIEFPDSVKILSPLLRSRHVTRVGVSGRIWYPDNGFMGWHTNSNNPGFRLYCTYAREGGKSFFRYRHPRTKEVVTSWDKEGWTFRVFRVCKELLWHSVYSSTDRFSIGYALYTADCPYEG
jgi:hypothetical protein